MKIHLISNMYPSGEAPNYGVFVKNTARILRSAGFSVDKTVLYKENNRVLKFIKYLFYYIKIVLKSLMKNYDIFYVHYASHNALPLLILKKMKKNIVIYTNVHGSDVVPEVPSQEKYQELVKKLLHASNLIITPSHYYKELVTEKYRVTTPISVFPSGGINKEIFYEREDRKTAFKELELYEGVNYIGYVSRLDVGKGWDILLRSLKELHEEGFLKKNNIKAIFVGSGKDDERFLELISEYKLENFIIHFPLLPQKKLNAIYNVCEVFCFPTTRKGESLGLVGLEAMACGTPVIGSRLGGLLDYMVDGANGFLFEPGSSTELADKIKQFHALPKEQKEKMSEAAKLTAQRYEIENISGKLIDIFDRGNVRAEN